MFGLFGEFVFLGCFLFRVGGSILGVWLFEVMNFEFV